MNYWPWLAGVLAVLFFGYGFYADRQRAKREAKQSEEHRTSEEYVIQQQMKFEERLRLGTESRLPDAVRGRVLYTYRNLMCDWFGKLAAQSRYDEPKLKKLRKDWLVYMELVEWSRTSNFLSLESKNEADREKHGRKAEEEMMQLTAIEDAFAGAVGPEAVQTLREIREKKYDSFNDAGELAPDGYRYRGWSLPNVPDEPVSR